MRIKIIATGEVVEAELLELDYVRVGFDKFYSPDEYRLEEQMVTVQVYRLWPSGHWDLTDVEVPEEPWNAETVESRAVTEAWLKVATYPAASKPVRMGLFTVVEGDIAHTVRGDANSARVGKRE